MPDRWKDVTLKSLPTEQTVEALLPDGTIVRGNFRLVEEYDDTDHWLNLAFLSENCEEHSEHGHVNFPIKWRPCKEA